MSLRETLSEIVEKIGEGQFLQALTRFESLILSSPKAEMEAIQADISALLLYLMPKCTIIERRLFINRIANSANLPNFLVELLLREDPMVSANIIQHAPIPAKTLMRLLSDGNETRQRAIAQRRDLTPELVTHLVDQGNLAILATLARNPTAPLNYAQMETLSDIAVHDPEIDEALAMRADLPAEIAGKLSKRLSKRSNERVSKIVETDIARKRAPLRGF